MDITPLEIYRLREKGLSYQDIALMFKVNKAKLFKLVRNVPLERPNYKK